jgi:hypothetical protein
VDQHSAGHRQFIRQHAARLAKLFKLAAIRPANEASFIVRQSPAELLTRGLRVVSAEETEPDLSILQLAPATRADPTASHFEAELL